MGMDMEPADFEWVTSEIMKIADICCAGRIVSVLEGGYGSYSPAARQQAAATLASTRSKRATGGNGNNSSGYSPEKPKPAGLDRHILASNAASHVHRLIDTYAERSSSAYPLLCSPSNVLHTSSKPK